MKKYEKSGAEGRDRQIAEPHVPQEGPPRHAPQSAPDGAVFLTEQQLAARHQKSVRTLRNLRVTGGYVPFRKFGRHVRYNLKDVVAYEQSSIKKSTSDNGGDHG